MSILISPCGIARPCFEKAGVFREGWCVPRFEVCHAGWEAYWPGVAPLDTNARLPRRVFDGQGNHHLQERTKRPRRVFDGQCNHHLQERGKGLFYFTPHSERLFF